MTKVGKFIGIDISKESFDVCHSSENGKYIYAHYKFNKESLSVFLSSLSEDVVCVMEATGNYHLRLAYALHDAGYAVCVVNPLCVKRFSQMRMVRAKTDKADAITIRDYALANQEELVLFTPTSPSLVEARQLMTLLDQFQVEDTMLRGQQEALSMAAVRSSTVDKMLKKRRIQLERDMKRLEEEIEKLIRQDNNDDYERLQSIPGIGKKSAAAIIATTDSMKKFENHKQVTSYFGIAPRIYQSGTSVRGKAHICKIGMARMRRMLYMAAVSASRCNTSCRMLYRRLVEAGKAKKLALIAVAHKLLKIAFALLKNKSSFNPKFSFKIACSET